MTTLVANGAVLRTATTPLHAITELVTRLKPLLDSVPSMKISQAAQLIRTIPDMLD